MPVDTNESGERTLLIKTAVTMEKTKTKSVLHKRDSASTYSFTKYPYLTATILSLYYFSEMDCGVVFCH